MIEHPLLLAAVCLSLQTQAATLPDALISGKVTASDPTSAASPIGFVIVEVTSATGLQQQVSGDSTGSYAVAGLSEGVYTLRFDRAGYIPLTLDVRVSAHSAVHLDASLDRVPPIMQTIKMLARDCGNARLRGAACSGWGESRRRRRGQHASGAARFSARADIDVADGNARVERGSVFRRVSSDRSSQQLRAAASGQHPRALDARS